MSEKPRIKRNSTQPLEIPTIRLYEEQLRIHGRVTLSQSNAELLLASRQLKITPEPNRPDLVIVQIDNPKRSLG
jgi:hypothetical protein